MIDKHHITRKYNQNGFTLVELLAIMVIILILSMISFRVANYAGMKARHSKVDADLYKLMQGFQKYYDFMGHYDTQPTEATYESGEWESGTDEDAEDWLDRFLEGTPRYDPWGNRYNMATFNTISRREFELVSRQGGNFSQHSNSGTRRAPNTAYTGERVSRVFQEYIVFSMGPDGAPGERNVNDDADDPNYPWRAHPEWNANEVDEYGGYGWYKISEIGYGDDIVRGNTTRTRGFPPCQIGGGL